MISIVVRTFIVYAVLVLFMRVTGKRQVGETELSELVTAFLISEVSSVPLSSPDTPLLYSLVPAVLLIALELFTSFLVTRSASVKKMLDGSPSFLICGGKPDQTELARQRISVDELLSAMRQKDVFDPASVSYAILEQNGQLSLFCDPNSGRSAFAHPLVIDGNVNEKALRAIGKDKNWLASQLRSRGCVPDDVFLYTFSDDGSENLIRKEKK